jgi:hypothetical protein
MNQITGNNVIFYIKEIMADSSESLSAAFKSKILPKFPDAKRRRCGFHVMHENLLPQLSKLTSEICKNAFKKLFVKMRC